MLKKLMLATAIVGATISTASAATVTGDVDLQVKLPEVLVLYHWDKAGIEFRPDKHEVVTGKGAGTYDLTGNAITVADADGNLTGAGVTDEVMNTDTVPNFANATTIPVVLKDAWAVRTLTTNGNAALSIANTDANHLLDTSAVVTKNAKVQATGVAAGTNITIPSKWEPTKGDISFDLDLSGAKRAGLHESAGSTFTLTLTGN